MIYLDNSATTRPYDGVVEKMARFSLESFGNPSSVHQLGIQAERAVRTARENVAQALSCKPGELYFTSGGTEADNLAIWGAVGALRRRGNRIVTTDSEHPAVREPLLLLEREGFEVVRLSTKGGAISPAEIIDAIDEKTILVAMMLVNNETGAVYPVSLVKEAIKRKRAPALLLCDCVQAFCKIPFSPRSLGADLVALSSHKVHGPKGVGALYVRDGVRIVPSYVGGGQEKGIRSGTENTPGIVGFGEAVRLFYGEKEEHFTALRRLGEAGRRILSEAAGVSLNPCPDGAPHILSVAVPGVRSETIVRYLEDKAIYVSAGSACSTNKKGGGRSEALLAFGLPPERIDCTVRASLSHRNKEEELLALAGALSACATDCK